MVAIFFLQDKLSLFKKFLKWLKPGGKVLISDYCKKAGAPSIEFGEYIKQRGYDLHDVDAYGQVIFLGISVCFQLFLTNFSPPLHDHGTSVT